MQAKGIPTHTLEHGKIIIDCMGNNAGIELTRTEIHMAIKMIYYILAYNIQLFAVRQCMVSS